MTTHVRNKKKSFVSSKFDAGRPEKLEINFAWPYAKFILRVEGGSGLATITTFIVQHTITDIQVCGHSGRVVSVLQGQLHHLLSVCYSNSVAR